MLTLDDFLEAADGILQRDILALIARKLFSYVERLGQEALHFPGAVDCQLVFLTQLVHAHDGNDVLQLLVPLQDALHGTGNLVMLFAQNLRGQDPGGGVQRIHGRVNAKAGNAAIQNGGSIQMGKGRCGSRIRQVVSGHIDRLHGGDGAFPGGSDTFLQGTHFRCQRGLVANGGWHTAQQCGNLGTGLGKAENVINEQQHVLMLHIPEVLCHGKSGKTYPHTGSGRLVHLTEDHGGFADNAGLGHFVVQVITLPGTLANAGKHGVAVVGSGNVVNQFLNQDGLAHACTAKQTDFAAFSVGADQVDDLDARFQNFGCGLLILVSGSGAVDRPALRRIGGRLVVNGLPQQVKDPAQTLLTNGNRDGRAGIDSFRTPLQSVRRGHGNAAHHIIADMLGDLGGNGLTAAGDLNGAEQRRKLIVGESNIKNRTHNLDHGSLLIGHRIQLLVIGEIQDQEPATISVISCVIAA